MRGGKFSDAADIYFKGKNNVRTALLNRTLVSFTIRNLTNEGPDSWAGKYYKAFGMEYLKNMIE